ncbi:GNAT family N-acetyltransferase [Deinococcus psychrotolerans]|uniref:GNAT family N-acetyltransferase n=2 Tax=Deinococcus psychrotolerans TaxID=2489213 RepID=A0A3G8YDJ2_9DEIO|nr:GNAT family N-acetyltransferase [Deinococcus psychrotolerans]
MRNAEPLIRNRTVCSKLRKMKPDPRRVTLQDLPALMPLYAALLSRPLTLERLELRFQRLEACPEISAQWLVEEDGATLALCDWEANDYGPPDSLRLNVWVEPGAHGRGFGTALLKLAEQTGKLLSANIADDDPPSLAWAEKRGFVFHAHRFESKLDPQEFDPAQHAQPLPEGVTLGDMAGASAAEWDELAALLIETFAQTPDAQGLPKWSVETARKAVQLSPQMRPEWLVCARRGGRLMGFTAALDMPGMVYNQMTGVADTAKGLGLAYLMKAELLRRLKAAGVSDVRTHNHAANLAMLRVNEKLGYVRQHGRWEVRRSGSS